MVQPRETSRKTNWGWWRNSLAPQLGIEPTTLRLTAYWPFAFLSAAQRLRVASPILFRAAALIFRRLRSGFGDFCAAGFFGGRPRFLIPSRERTCVICSSILVFCRSKPFRAAFRISRETVGCLGIFV